MSNTQHTFESSDKNCKAIESVRNSVRNTFFQNIFSRNSNNFMNIPESVCLFKTIPLGWYNKLCEYVNRAGGVCVKSCNSLLAPVVAIITKAANEIILVLNPAIHSCKEFVLKLCHCTKSFIGVGCDSVMYWQNISEPIVQKQYSYT